MTDDIQTVREREKVVLIVNAPTTRTAGMAKVGTATFHAITEDELARVEAVVKAAQDHVAKPTPTTHHRLGAAVDALDPTPEFGGAVTELGDPTEAPPYEFSADNSSGGTTP